MFASILASIRRLVTSGYPSARASFDSREQLEAMEIIKKHGLEARRYMASVDVGEDMELRNALIELQIAGYLIFDNKSLVGVIRPTDAELRERPRLRLVVDNAPND